MFSKILRDLSLLFVAVSCTHGEPMVSSWSELDSHRNQQCQELVPFQEKESLGLKSIRFLRDGSLEFVLVSHMTRGGQLESRIGIWTDLKEEPTWKYTVKKNVLGFLGRNEFIEVHGDGIDWIQGPKKTSISKGYFDIPPEVISISQDRFAVVNGKEVSVWKRSGPEGFILEQKVKGVLSWQSFGPSLHFVAKAAGPFQGYLADAVGLVMKEVPSQDSFLVRESSGSLVYEATSGELLGKAGLKQGSHSKIWDIGYLREIPAGNSLLLQRWVDGESLVEKVWGPGLKFEDLGVLPAQWWIKSLAVDSRGGLRFVVEADRTWYLCQKGQF